MSERTRNIIVGITSLGGLAGLIFLLMIFGYLPSWMEDGYIVHVQLKSASGLSPGSRVLMNGIDIGRVVEVGLENTPTGPKVSAAVRIRPEVRVPAGVKVRAEAPFIGGSPTLAFDASHLDPRQPGYSELIASLPLDGRAIIVGEIFNPLGELAEQFRTALAEPSRSFERVADHFEKLSQEWVLVARNLNTVLELRMISDVDKGDKVGNLATVLARTDMRLKELEVTIAAVNTWLADEQLREDIRQTAANAKELTAKLGMMADKAQGLLDDAKGDVHRLVNRYMAAADDLSGAILAMKEALDQAGQGHGSVGKLLNDPALYNNMTDAAIRLGAALTEIRLLVEKWKKEGLPIQF